MKTYILAFEKPAPIDTTPEEVIKTSYDGLRSFDSEAKIITASRYILVIETNLTVKQLSMFKNIVDVTHLTTEG